MCEGNGSVEVCAGIGVDGGVMLNGALVRGQVQVDKYKRILMGGCKAVIW